LIFTGLKNARLVSCIFINPDYFLGGRSVMDYEGFKLEIYKLTDINLSLYKEKQMKRRIDSLIKKNGYDLYVEYVQALKRDKNLYNEFIIILQ
jgi:chemotaxis methyl-accepting protein methylase